MKDCEAHQGPGKLACGATPHRGALTLFSRAYYYARSGRNRFSVYTLRLSLWTCTGWHLYW